MAAREKNPQLSLSRGSSRALFIPRVLTDCGEKRAATPDLQNAFSLIIKNYIVKTLKYVSVMICFKMSTQIMDCI